MRAGIAAAALGLAALAAAPAAGQGSSGIPHLRTVSGVTQLVVDGAPFLIRGGELGNSAASDPDHLREAWPRLAALNLNTVLAPVYWEHVEPAEGRFDFALVDSLLAQARRHGLRLVLLWFGSWKNSMSSYAPAWVKTDARRFPRAEGSGGRMEILSPFHPASRDADARAFAALMRHLRHADAGRNTVLMVQVENEVGMIPDARDHSPAADSAFAAPVPEAVLAALRARPRAAGGELIAAWRAAGARARGSWAEVFGPGCVAEEAFMAWHFARYVEHVAAAGKAEHPLPLFVNAALPRPGYAPGRYPSAGPLPHLAAIWRVGAPSIDFLSPDVYFPNFVEWVDRYAAAGTPLFVPEAGPGPGSAAQALYVVGAHAALGYSPFAVEKLDSSAAIPLRRAYALLDQLAPLIAEHGPRGTLAGVAPSVAFDGTVDDAPRRVEMGGYALTVSFRDPWTAPEARARMPPSGGLVIALAEDEYLVAGTGLVVTFAPASGTGSAGILGIQQGRYEAGRWVGGLWLNGDESHQGRHLRIPPGEFQIQRVRVYRY